MPYEYTEVKIKLHNLIHSCIGDVFYITAMKLQKAN
jgi:hypothetical protein